MIELTPEEKERFEKWVHENVGDDVMPPCDLYIDGLIYNLIHLIRGDGAEPFYYRPNEIKEIKSWRDPAEEEDDYGSETR